MSHEINNYNQNCRDKIFEVFLSNQSSEGIFWSGLCQWIFRADDTRPVFRPLYHHNPYPCPCQMYMYLVLEFSVITYLIVPVMLMWQWGIIRYLFSKIAEQALLIFNVQKDLTWHASCKLAIPGDQQMLGLYQTFWWHRWFLHDVNVI